MISEARVVVIGGGIGGVSTLYHLARLGWSDVALVEANELTSGSTWHAAGLCTQFIQSYNIMQLLKTSVELYGSLEDETGLPVDFHQCGSVRIALGLAERDGRRCEAAVGPADRVARVLPALVGQSLARVGVLEEPVAVRIRVVAQPPERGLKMGHERREFVLHEAGLVEIAQQHDP